MLYKILRYLALGYLIIPTLIGVWVFRTNPDESNWLIIIAIYILLLISIIAALIENYKLFFLYYLVPILRGIEYSNSKIEFSYNLFWNTIIGIALLILFHYLMFRKIKYSG